MDTGRRRSSLGVCVSQKSDKDAKYGALQRATGGREEKGGETSFFMG